MELTVADPQAACLDDGLAEAIRKAQAGLAKTDVSNVEVTCSVVGAGGRRLAGSISFSYTIAVASADAASQAAAAIEGASEEQMKALIEAELPSDHSYEIQVTGISARAIVVTVTTTTTAEAEEELDDSHARTTAALGSIPMALAIAAAVVWSP